jgi:hypothetical protein
MEQQTNGKWVIGLNAGALSGTQNGAAIDTAGFDEAVIVAVAGAITAGGTWDVKVQEDTASGFASPTDIASAVFAQFTNAIQNTLKVGRIKLEAGREQYIRINSVQATQPVAGGVMVLLRKAYSSALYDTPAFDV